MTVELRKVFDGVADVDKTYELFQRHQSHPNNSWRISGHLWRGEWWEITEEVFWHFLDVMPPLDARPGGFTMLEPTAGDVHSSFMRINGRFFHIYIQRRPWHSSGECLPFDVAVKQLTNAIIVERTD